jgi:hypothetical protein
MTAESSPRSADNLSANLSANVTTEGDANGFSAIVESPELLRWRADILMDEMMLGAVDASGNDQANGMAPAVEYDGAGTGESPTDQAWPAGSDIAAGAPSSSREAPTAAASTDTAPPPEANEPPTQPTGDGGAMSRSDVAAGDVAAGDVAAGDVEWWQHPFHVEPRHPAAPPAPMAPHSAAPQVTMASAAAAGQEMPGSSESLLRPPSFAQTSPPAEAAPGPPDRRGAAGARLRTGKRTNLLPRMSSVDTEALWREMEEMRTEIEAVMPAQHEWSVRSRHLLDKGETILRQSPDRTAEVEYYLNQVRGILARVRQSYIWSQLYMKRLNIYLWAWIAFATVAASGCFLYREALTGFFTLLTGLPADGFLMQMLPFWFGTMAVGALGGAVGARVNMIRHQSLEHGFFDRKYSLRGLLLPLLAAFAAMILFVPFALLAHFVPVSPLIALSLIGVAAVLAFLFGFFQEALYGTRP